MLKLEVLYPGRFVTGRLVTGRYVTGLFVGVPSESLTQIHKSYKSFARYSVMKEQYKVLYMIS